MSRRHRPLYRTASICISLIGALTNAAIAVQVFSACQVVKWGEVESEWASDSWIQVADGIKIMCILLSLYFVSSALVCAIGLVGILRSKASLVRFYRDYSIADLSFCAIATLGGSYAAFMSSTRAILCEEFSRHPELMRDMLEMGLSSENCEHWLARAMTVLIGAMVVILVVRLHFLLAVSSFYSQLIRQYTWCSSSCCSHLPMHSRGGSRRISLVSSTDDDAEMVYVAVPRSSLPREVQTTAQEMWMSSCSASEHRHRHHRHCSREMGRIRLPVRQDEGLLSGKA